MRNSDTFYQLTIGDVQHVAVESIGRDLTEDELNQVISRVEDRIEWFNTIEDAISEIDAA